MPADRLPYGRRQYFRFRQIRTQQCGGHRIIRISRKTTCPAQWIKNVGISAVSLQLRVSVPLILEIKKGRGLTDPPVLFQLHTNVRQIFRKRNLATRPLVLLFLRLCSHRFFLYMNMQKHCITPCYSSSGSVTIAFSYSSRMICCIFSRVWELIG